MCISPIRIQRKLDPEIAALRYKSLPAYVPWDKLNETLPTEYGDFIVPCGKCLECIKQRQNDFAFRCVREAEKYGTMHFVTLTYAPEHLPFSYRFLMVDRSTGECFADGVPTQLTDDKYLNIVRSEFAKFNAGKEPFYHILEPDLDFWKDLPYDDNYAYYISCSPSLYRRQVRLWLKASRVAYKRAFGHSLPEFKYLVCGEMGPRTSRPHYHLIFLGLDTVDVHWIVNRWKYGFAQVKKVNQFNKDGSNGFIAASKYIGKYLSKGSFECPSVINGDVEKPRICCSVSFGSEPFSENVINFYRCYDVFGKYDINTLQKEDGSYLSSQDCLSLYCLVKERSYYDIQNSKFRLPKLLLKKLWYIQTIRPVDTDSNGLLHTFKKVFSPSTIQIIFQSFVLSDFIQDYTRKLRQDGVDPFSEISCNFFENFVSSQMVRKSLNKASYETFFKQFYSKSKF